MTDHATATVTVQGRALQCLICAHDQFWEQRIQLSTQVFSFLDPDSHAHCAVCARCGYVHMFIPSSPVRVDEPAAGVVPGAPEPA
jgi:predicted nucleic-acid-binding Zn-ribbon protein